MPLPAYNPADAASKCLTAGEYDAELKRVEDATSGTSGKPMQKWTFRVHGTGGTASTVYDYCVVPDGLFKLKQLARAMGRLSDFEAGEFQADNHVGEAIRVKVDIEEGGGQFPDKNRIVAFISSATIINGTPRPTSALPARSTSLPSSQGNGAANVPDAALNLAKRQAWEAFKKKMPGHNNDQLKILLSEAIEGIFPGKEPQQLNAAQWQNLVKWGFVPQEDPIASASGPGIPEDDIPFAPNRA